MKYICCVFLVLSLLACGQGKKYHKSESKTELASSSAIVAILDFQEELNLEYKDPETSPLPDRYRKNFDGLEFFKPDTNYIIVAKFERTPDAVPFLLATTTSRKTEELLYGIAHFELNGQEHELEIYQSLGLLDQEEYEDYLFLPFLDETNGEETYGGGRYIDLTIPEGETITIDFNRAYNPYCAYNKKYSCPLVPRQNCLKTKVIAGVKDFIKK
ncbi:DUF1684 domain-containing protein [uncultured Croceitalea sp.]|uniref:DUF1684 domain-containing protein n=1 Tax=uncultured Croceitalea sp. TaxID=1798908 RepID=UPI00330662EE